MMPATMKRYVVALCHKCGEPRVVRMPARSFLCFKCGSRNTVSKAKFIGATDDIDEATNIAKKFKLGRLYT
jgi:predicted nucleic-acid-binding Zn-ribbon protein